MRNIGIIACLLLGCIFTQNTQAQVFDTDTRNNAASIKTNNNVKKILRSPLVDKSEVNKEKTKSQKMMLLYFRDFEIETTPSGRVMCSFKLMLHNSMDVGVNTLGMQLVWPSMKTTAMFYDVPARSERYLNMTLMGQGCYSMDQQPNIVVNLCRVKGLSGEGCSSSIRWVKLK